jgi:hypothetical protein
VDASFVEDAAAVRRAMEYYADQGWTDGLPVVPVTESYLAEFLAQTGALIHETISAAVVLSPEHARLFASAGWSKSDIARFMYDHAVRTGAELAAAGKEAVSSKTRWRLPADHPDALPVFVDGPVRVLNSPAAVLVVVAGAGNAGVSAVVETFGPRGGPPPVTLIATRLP